MAIVRLALPVAAHQLFDYWLPAGLDVRPGSVLLARLGRRRLVGVAVELIASSDVEPERVQPIDEILASIPPLPDDLRALARFIAAYYQEPIGLCFAQMVPPLGAGRRPRPDVASCSNQVAARVLNAEGDADAVRELARFAASDGYALLRKKLARI